MKKKISIFIILMMMFTLAITPADVQMAMAAETNAAPAEEAEAPDPDTGTEETAAEETPDENSGETTQSGDDGIQEEPMPDEDTGEETGPQEAEATEAEENSGDEEASTAEEQAERSGSAEQEEPSSSGKVREEKEPEQIEKKGILSVLKAGLKAAGSTTTYKAHYVTSGTGGSSGVPARVVAFYDISIDGKDYEGTCAWPGRSVSTSGTAEIKKISNSSDAARLIYEYAVNKGWWDDPDVKDDSMASALDIPGTKITKKLMIEFMSQYTMRSRSEWISGMTSNGWTTIVCDRLIDFIEGVDIGKIEVPDGFSMYYGDTGNDSQPFLAWTYSANGRAMVRKVSSDPEITGQDPAAYSLAGAVYYMYTDSSCETRAKDAEGDKIVLTTGSNGESNTVFLKAGIYWVKEHSAPPGYELDPTAHKVKVVSDETAVVTSKDKPVTSHVYLKKSAAASQVSYLTAAPVNYSLQGAVYDLYTDSSCTTRAKDVKGKNITLTTDKNGSTATAEVLPGTYYAKEKTASKGFRLDGVRSVKVTRANTSDSPALIKSEEVPVYGTLFRLRKTDKSGKNGWKNLLKARYRLSYYDIDPSSASVSGKPSRSWVFETVKKLDNRNEPYAGIDFMTDKPVSGDAFFTEKVGGKDTRVLPLGVFTIEETEAPPGLARDNSVYRGKVYQPSNGADASTSFDTGGKDSMTIEVGTKNDIVNHEQPQGIELRLEKKSSLTGRSEADGTARESTKGSLEGAEYKVYYDDPRKAEPLLIGSMITDENGQASIDKSSDGEPLDLGRYYIEEVKASAGYSIDALFYENIPGKYENGRHVVDARASETNTGKFTYTVESLEPPHETHIYKTDITTGRELPGAELQVLDSSGNIIEEWTSGEEPHDIYALHDETQGIRDGSYTLREITAPYGYDIAEEVTFRVEYGKVSNEVHMENAPVEIRTTACDAETQSHSGTFSSAEKIRDKVIFSNLYAGREYTFKGVLMDKATGEPLTDSEGREITAERKYIPEGEEGTLVSGETILEFTVDASGFEKGRSVVAFEKVFREDRELAVHADLDDEDQTIRYGGIASTEAVGKKSGSRNILADDKAKIIDTVRYMNLVPGMRYRLDGELYDKTTGRLTGIKGSAEFTPKEPDGSTKVQFAFDAAEYKGHSLVVFEKLSVIVKDDENGSGGSGEKAFVLDKHEDPGDEAQTVYVPEIGTCAEDSETGDHISFGDDEITIIDTVEYRSLAPGTEYTVIGILMDKAEGDIVRSGRKKVTAAAAFTPENSDGSIEIEFRFDGTKLCGKKLVAFEYLYCGNALLALHADLNDEDQTVQVPEIGTKIGKRKKDKVIDTVSYKGLIPGREYVMRGYFVTKREGKRVKGSDGEVRFSPDSPDGSVEVFLKPGSGSANLVAFETCLLITEEGEEETVGEHKDIRDRGQTYSPTPKTGDDSMIMLFTAVLIMSMLLLAVLRKLSHSRRN